MEVHVRSVDQLRHQREVFDLQGAHKVVEGKEVHERDPERGPSAWLGEVRAAVVLVGRQRLCEFFILACFRAFPHLYLASGPPLIAIPFRHLFSSGRLCICSSCICVVDHSPSAIVSHTLTSVRFVHGSVLRTKVVPSPVERVLNAIESAR